MSVDPFANTVTVKNILQHIISPKIVSDGSGGYVTKTDLANIDNIILQSAGNGVGTALLPLKQQSGKFRFPASSATVTVYHASVTTSSIIFTTIFETESSTKPYVTSIIPATGLFVINLSAQTSASTNYTLGWFIASF